MISLKTMIIVIQNRQKVNSNGGFCAGKSRKDERGRTGRQKARRIFVKSLDKTGAVYYNKQAECSREDRIQCTEKYSRGRRGAPAKGVGRVTGARVQISPSPFSKNPSTMRFDGFFVAIKKASYPLLLKKAENVTETLSVFQTKTAVFSHVPSCFYRTAMI